MAERVGWAFRLLAGVFVVLCLGPGAAHAQEIDPNAFRDLYADATARLTAYYDHAGMVIAYRGRGTSTQPAKYPDREDSARLVYKAKRPWCVLEKTEVVADGVSGEDSVRLVDGRGSLVLTRSARSRAYQVEFYSEDAAEGWLNVHELVPAPRAAFSLGGGRLLDLWSSTNRNIRKCVRRGDHWVIEYDEPRRDVRIPGRIVLDAKGRLEVRGRV
jgi:hypothetical protein